MVLHGNTFSSVASTNTKHDMGCLMYQCEHLGRLAVCTIYKNIWGCIIDKSETSALFNFKNSMSIVANNAIECNEDTYFFKVFRQHIYCRFNIGKAECPFALKAQSGTQLTDCLGKRSGGRNGSNYLTSIHHIVLQILLQPVLATLNVHNRIIDIQIEIIVYTSAATEHREWNGLYWFLLQEQETHRHKELGSKLLKLAKCWQLFSRQPRLQHRESRNSFRFIVACADKRPSERFRLDIIQSYDCHTIIMISNRDNTIAFICKITLFLLLFQSFSQEK